MVVLGLLTLVFKEYISCIVDANAMCRLDRQAQFVQVVSRPTGEVDDLASRVSPLLFIGQQKMSIFHRQDQPLSGRR